MQQEFAIPFCAQDGRIDDFDLLAAECGDRFADLGHRTELRRFAAHDSALAHQLAAHFKLWLDEQNQFAARLPLSANAALKTAGNTWVAEMKETSIEMNSTGSGTCCGFEIARVGLLQQADARIGAQTGIDLAVTGIDGEHAGGAVLQHAIGKAAGGGADIHADGVLQARCSSGRARPPV